MEARLAKLETRVRDLQAELEDFKMNVVHVITTHHGYDSQGRPWLRDRYTTNRDIAKGTTTPPSVGTPYFTPGDTSSPVNRKGGKTRRSKRRI